MKSNPHPLSPAPVNPPDWRNRPWRLNAYYCGRHITTTVDVDEGVTPFMIGCTYCNATAKSAFYPDQRPIPPNIPEPTQEWFKPTEAETNKLHPAEQDHVRRGGLMMRPRTSAEPLRHPSL